MFFCKRRSLTHGRDPITPVRCARSSPDQALTAADPVTWVVSESASQVQRWSPAGRRRGVTDVELSDSETPVLEESYRELRLPLLRLAFLLTGSRETAEDVVQSAFASA